MLRVRGHPRSTFHDLNGISPQANRRRRILTRAVPIIVVAAAAFAVGILLGAGSEIKAAERFAEAWADNAYEAMHDELSAEAAAEYPLEEFEAAYREAAATATTASLRPGEGRESEDGATVPIIVETRAFGEIDGELEVPLSEGLIEWSPELVFPGLRKGEVLDRRTRTPPRGDILAPTAPRSPRARRAHARRRSERRRPR